MWYMRILKFSIVCLLLLVSATVVSEQQALALSVNGSWLPGALMFGSTAPGAEVEVLGHTQQAGADGSFVFGLGRDAKGEIEITATLGDKQLTQAYSVKSREYNIQRIEGVASKYVSPPESVLERIRDEARRVREARKLNTQAEFFRDTFIWPAEGPITGVYGSQRFYNGVPKRPHYGLDIAGPTGTPVYAPVAGQVSFADTDLYYSGGTLIIDHGRGVSSTFIHLSELLVEKGDRVKQGQLIAKIGATGRVTGPHLDWRVNWFDYRLDPQLLLPPR